VSAGQQPRDHTRLFPVVVHGLTGFIDSTGRMIIPPRFANTFPFTEGLAAVQLGGGWGYIDTTGAIVIPPRFDYASAFSEHLAWVEIGGHRGYIDLSGRVVIAPRFDVASEFSEGRALVTIGRTLGYIDHTGKLVYRQEMPSLVGEVMDFSQGLAAVYVRGKWGYIDTTGTMVIAPQFRPDPRPWVANELRFSEGRAAVPAGAKWGYIDRTGRVTIEWRFDDAGPFQEGLAPVRVGRLYGYIDTVGTMVIALRFPRARAFSEGLAVAEDSARRSGYIDHTGTFVIAPQWHDAAPFSGALACVQNGGECEYIDHAGHYRWQPPGRASALVSQADTTRRLLVVNQNGRFGYIDTAGRIVIPPQFDHASEFRGGLALVKSANKWGFIDANGRPVIPPRFDAAHTFSEGLAAVQVGSKWGYIDRMGRMVITPQFDGAGWFSDGLAQAMVGGKWGFIDTTGAIVIPPQFEFSTIGSHVSGFSGGRAWVSVPTSRYALIDRGGRIISGPYDFAKEFSDGFAAVREFGDRLGRIESRWGYIDSTGRVVIRPRPNARAWSLAENFAQGRAPVRIGEKWGYIDKTGTVIIEARFDDARASEFHDGLAPVQLGKKWGYIDTTGAVVIALQFSSAGEFSEGLAPIELDGRWGYIDRAGQVVIAPQFDRTAGFNGGVAQVDLQSQAGPQKGYINRAGRLVWDPRQIVLAPPAAAEPDTGLLEGTGSFIDRVAALVERLEGAEAGTQRLDLTAEQLGPRLNTVATRLARHLEANPNDVRALILSARLGRFRQVTEPIVTKGGDSLPTFASLGAEYAPYHAALNRALALEPNNAEVHYWKARLYGLTHDWMGMLYGVTPPPATEGTLARAYADSAVRFGRQAVELAPDRVPYREALAIYLILNDQDGEAAAVLRDVAGGHHPMARLLADWEAIPVPPGAVALSGEARGMARMWMEEGAIADYPFLRVRMYVVMMPADSVQAFYRKRWPGFQLIPEEDERSGAARVRSFVQHSRWRSEGFVPVRNKAEIPDEATDGVTVALIEITNPPPEVRQKFPVPVGKVFCSLSFINVRRFDAR
jgi:hypothetical protein